MSNIPLLEDGRGNKTMMLTGYMATLIVGGIISIAGAVAMFYSLPDSAAALIAGPALMGSGGYAKAVQEKWSKPDA